MVSFHRTLRLPEDSSTYPLPPGLGLLQVIMQSETGVDKPNFLVPLYRREAFGSASLPQPGSRMRLR